MPERLVIFANMKSDGISYGKDEKNNRLYESVSVDCEFDSLRMRYREGQRADSSKREIVSFGLGAGRRSGTEGDDPGTVGISLSGDNTHESACGLSGGKPGIFRE